MTIDWDVIDHVTKVDPAEALPPDLEILEGTDLIMVGGSDGVTRENSLATIRAVREHFPETPLFQEPYSAEHVSRETIEAVDRVSVPAVYNGDRENFVAKHLAFFTEMGSKPESVIGSGLPVLGNLVESRGREAIAAVTEKILPEGYVVQNLESKAAAVSGVERAFTPEQVTGAALATEAFYGFPIFYVEYSGRYGGPGDVVAASTYLEETVLLYGGGIDSRERASEILAAGADAIVVGDCFHDEPERYRETIV